MIIAEQVRLVFVEGLVTLNKTNIYITRAIHCQMCVVYCSAASENKVMTSSPVLVFRNMILNHILKQCP